MVRRGTYSIVARGAAGELGAAVQSHWFSVGSVVAWARPEAGAVCTQSVAEPAYGPRLLDRLAEGEEPAGALRALLDADEQRAFRQVAAVAPSGAVGVHTGEGCIAFAGHATGDGFSCQANMMASEAVWPAMAQAFAAAPADAPLARRMLAALDAGEAAGGDVRGRQSAALVVAPAAGEPWQRLVELRVEDHEDPLAELRRLLDLHDAYALASDGDELAGQGRHEEAGERYRRAAELAPGSHELLFWAGLAAVQAGDRAGGVEQVRRAIALQPGWAELLGRLDARIAPAAPAVRETLGISARPAS